uniref:WAT1-related protein n=1 Tax=Kalanchoe fedtschenkoi TaxID=63787 RepID=A0A7N0V9K1_KALFE
MGAASGSNNDNRMAYLAVVGIRFIYAVMFLLSKVVFDGGMNNNIFVFYRQAAATLFLLPFALFYGWKNAPPLSFDTFCKIFLLAFVGITLSLNFNGIGLAYTSATLTAATSNAVPVITFFLAVLLRMELLKWRTKSGAAKVAGILICMGGVAVLAFYKGPCFSIIPQGKQLVHTKQDSHESRHSTATWLKGCFFLFACNFSWASWIVFQVNKSIHNVSKSKRTEEIESADIY